LDREEPPGIADMKSKLEGLKLDALAKEALTNLAWLYAQCGYSLEEASAAFEAECGSDATAGGRWPTRQRMLGR
jgi:hypothetical protein